MVLPATSPGKRQDGGGGEEQPCPGIWDSLRLLCRNPELCKVVLAAGMLAVATIMSPVAPLVLVELRSNVWGEDMAAYTALVNAANGIVAMAFSGSFGRLGDRMDRRLAMVLVGILGFMPSWALLAVGQNAVGLAAFSVLTALGGVACITVTGCPTCYAMVSDVIPAGDREVAFGCCFAGVVFIAILGNLGGFLVNLLFDRSATAILVYVLLIDLAFFLTVACIRLPGEAREVSASAAKRDPEGEAATDLETLAAEAEDSASTPLSGPEGDGHDRKAENTEELRSCEAHDGECEASWAGGSSCSSSSRGAAKGTRGKGATGTESFLTSLAAPLQLMCGHAPLRYLCIVAALVSLPEITLTDVSAQYALDSFDLVHAAEGAKKQEVSLLFQWPGYALLLPAFVITGMLGKHYSALTVLRTLIPVTGLAMSFPVLLRIAPRMWIVPIVGVTVPLAMVVFAPLQTLITQVSPEDRIGEAMGAVGASKQVAGLVSNMMVSGLVPVLLGSGLKKPLWIFYPLASASTLLAFAFAMQIRVEGCAGAPLGSAKSTRELPPLAAPTASGREIEEAQESLGKRREARFLSWPRSLHLPYRTAGTPAVHPRRDSDSGPSRIRSGPV